MVALLLVALSCGISFFVNYVVIRRAHIKGDLATVNQRSNHSIPTPLGGGIGILAGYIITSLLWLTWLYQELNYAAVVPYIYYMLPFIKGLIPVTTLAIVSWWNDKHEVRASRRLFIQFVCVALGVITFKDIPMFMGLFFMLGWVWFINLYNFMDGINGILAIETISILLGIFSVLWIDDSLSGQMVMLGLLGAATLGFMYLNFPNAKIFAGDVGSIPLGFIVGSLCLQLGFKTNFISAFILPLYFIADATLLLFQRALRGEKVWEAHSGHYYQQAVRKGSSHARVTLTIGAVNLVLIGLAMLAAYSEMMQIPALLLALLAVGGCLWHFKRRNA